MFSSFIFAGKVDSPHKTKINQTPTKEPIPTTPANFNHSYSRHPLAPSSKTMIQVE